MPHYDFKIKNRKKIIARRTEECFGDAWNRVNNIESLSVYVLPYGNKKKNEKVGHKVFYGFNKSVGSILDKYNTSRKLGLERWAETLAFVPGTSFKADFKDIKEPIIDGVQMSAFQFKEPKNKKVSAIMRQLWINGTRYSWEEPYTNIPKFVLHYYKPGMRKLELFNLHLLAHHTIDILNYDYHASRIVNPKYHTQKDYNKLMNSNGAASSGTRALENTFKIDCNTYQIIKTPIAKAVKKAMSDINAGRKPATLDKLYKTWKNK